MNGTYHGLVLAAVAATLAVVASAQAQIEPHPAAKHNDGIDALVVRITVGAERKDDFLNLIRSRVRESRASPAVVDFQLLATDDPLSFVTFERFRDQAAFEAFEHAPGSATFLERLTPMLARAPDVQRLHALP